jgi:hypothetical protein
MAQTNQVAIRLSVEGTEQVKAALLSLGATGEAALKRLNFDTATGGSRLFGATLEEAGGVARNYASQLGPIGGILSTLGGGWLAAGAAAGGFGLLLEQSTAKAEAYEQAMRGVDAVLKATDDSSGVTREQIAAMADDISEHTLQTRDSVLAAAEELATFGVEGPKAFKKTLDAAADLAASPVFHGDLAAAVKAIGMASEGTFTALQRAGVALSAQQKEQVKGFDEAGNHAAALQVVIDALEKKIGGTGAAQDQGLTGATHNLGEAWDKLLATLGESDHAGGTASKVLNSLAGDLAEIERVGKSQGFLNVLTLLVSGGKASLDIVDKGLQAQGGASNQAGSSPATIPVSGIYDTTPEGRAAIQREHDRELLDSLAAAHKFNQGLNAEADELAKGKLQQAIDKEIAAAAKAAGTSVSNYTSNPRFTGEYQSTVANATSQYNNQHAEEFANKAAEAARKAKEAFDKWLNEEQRWTDTLVKDVADQEKLFEDLAHKQDEAYAQMVEAQDAFQVDLLKGTSDYYGAAEKQIDDWLANQSKAIDSERDKELAALDAKKAAYDKDNVAFAEYQLDKTAIEQTADDKRAALQAQMQQRQLELQRQQNGALQQFIDAENADWNQSLKQVAADGLNEVGNDIEGLIKGTESLSKALKQLPLDITADLAKKGIEKYVLGPIGDELNSLIGGAPTSKPDGTRSNPYHVVMDGIPAGGGGILPSKIPSADVFEGPNPLDIWAQGSFGTGVGTPDFHPGPDPSILDAFDQGSTLAADGISGAFKTSGGGFVVALEKVFEAGLSDIGSLFSGSGGSSGWSSLFNFSGAAGSASTAASGASIFSDIASFFGFASGGEFDVSGNGGTDSQLVAFRATPGERVSVRTPGQQQAAAPSVTVVVNGHIYGDEALKATIEEASKRGAALGYASVKRDLPALMSDAQARFG